MNQLFSDSTQLFSTSFNITFPTNGRYPQSSAPLGTGSQRFAALRNSTGISTGSLASTPFHASRSKNSKDDRAAAVRQGVNQGHQSRVQAAWQEWAESICTDPGRYVVWGRGMDGLGHWRRESKNFFTIFYFRVADVVQALPILKAAYDMGINTVKLAHRNP